MADNCKVHFAVSTVPSLIPFDVVNLYAAGARYGLMSAYPYVKDKASSYKVDDLAIKKGKFEHTIIDSGLFTLMWGGAKDKKLTESDMWDWMHRLVLFATENDIPNCSFVECDCQKLMGPELAWEMRQEMRKLLHHHEIINVFHLEDGMDGFERLVDFTDYLAISVPELRFNRGKVYKQAVCSLTRRARAIRKDVKIHLLGCTEVGLLRQNKFCTSADSSTWSGSTRWGFMANGRHIDELSDKAVEDGYQQVCRGAKEIGIRMQKKSPTNMNRYAATYYTILHELQKYTRACGPQD